MAHARSHPGLRRRKLDLHIHTPASLDFDDKKVTPEDIIQEAIKKGLDGIAITDHNSGEWVDKIKEAAASTNLVVFPGVEISCSGGKGGLHLVALFNPTKGTAHIRGVLSALGIPPEKYGDPSFLVSDRVSFAQAVEIIQSKTWQGVAILPHINSAKGIFRDMEGEQRKILIQNPAILAAEGTDFQDNNAKKKGKRAIDLLNGSDSDYRRKMAVYQASDNPNPGSHGHTLTTIGNRCSYFKLEQINLDGLIQCFYDPDVRISQDFEPTPTSFPFIKTVKVSSGFLDGQTVEFHPGLNSILGAKGTGKSLLIELLRFSLGQQALHPDIVKDHKSKLAIRLGDYGSVEVTYVDAIGEEHRIKRTYTSYDENGFDVDYDPSLVFPVLFLSQNEIIKIAEDEDRQLDFIDRFFDFQTYKTQIRNIEEKLGHLDQQMADGIKAISKIDELSNEIATLNLDLARLDEQLKHESFQMYSTYRQKNQVFEDQVYYVRQIKDSWNATYGKLESVKLPELPDELMADPSLRRNLDVLRKARSIVEDQSVALKVYPVVKTAK